MASQVRPGTKAYALAAIDAARDPNPPPRPPSKKRQERERAVAIAKAQLEHLLSKLPPVPTPRKDRVRPKVTAPDRLPTRLDAREAQARRRLWLNARISEQGGRCAYCLCVMHRRPRELRFATADHVIPLSKGGTDAFENIAAACATCNNEKGDMMPDDYRAIWRERHNPTPGANHDQ